MARNTKYTKQSDGRYRTSVKVGTDFDGTPIVKHPSGKTIKELDRKVEELKRAYIEPGVCTAPRYKEITAMPRKNEPSLRETPVCAYCRDIVHPGRDGGRIRIPTTITGEPDQDVMLHTRCLNEYIDAAEAGRRPITQTTQFKKETDGTVRRLG